MIGYIKSIQKYRGGMFFISGDDGVTYFSHRLKLQTKNHWKYCWLGNRVEFDILDEGKEHLSAVNVRPVEILDPLANEKKIKKEELKKAIEAKENKKQENIAKQQKQKELADQRKAYEKEHTVYIIQERIG